MLRQNVGECEYFWIGNEKSVFSTIIESMFDFSIANICSHAIIRENKCSIQRYWEECERGNCDGEKKKSMRTYAVYGNVWAAAAELIWQKTGKGIYRDRRRKRANGDCGMATGADRYGVVVMHYLIAGDLFDFGLRLLFHLFRHCSGSVGVPCRF